jgi:drug/metabolite transporter (DMT)-like permease
VNQKILSFSLLALLGIVWSLGYSIARYCMTHGVSPLGYSFWQSIGPMMVLGGLLFLSRTPFSVSNRHLTYYVVSAILGIALPNSIMYFSAGHLPSGLVALIVNTVPIFTYPLAILAKQEGFQWRRLLALLLGCLGIFGLMFIDHPIHSLNELFSGEPGWILLTLLTPFSFACCSIFIAKRPQIQSSPLALSFGMLVCSTLFLTPFVVQTHSFYRFHLPMNTNDFLILTEIGLSSLGYLIFFALLRLSGAVYYSMVGGVVAIAGMIWGAVFFQESVLLVSSIPAVLILAAIVLLGLRAKP